MMYLLITEDRLYAPFLGAKFYASKQNFLSCGLSSLSTFPYCCRQILQHHLGCLPVNTGIGNAHPLFQTTWSFWRNLLITFVDVRLDHQTNNTLFAGPQLFSHDCCDFRLITMIFVRVAM